MKSATSVGVNCVTARQHQKWRCSEKSGTGEVLAPIARRQMRLMMPSRGGHEPLQRSRQLHWWEVDMSWGGCSTWVQRLCMLLVNDVRLNAAGGDSDWGFLLVSSWMSLWCGFWHFRHRYKLPHWRAKWPRLRQFKHNLLSRMVESILSRGSALKCGHVHVN